MGTSVKYSPTIYKSTFFYLTLLSHNKISAGFGTRNPNQFVDQGYNNYPNSQGNSNQARVIPIAMENSHGDGPFNNTARGPVSPAPIVIQK